MTDASWIVRHLYEAILAAEAQGLTDSAHAMATASQKVMQEASPTISADKRALEKLRNISERVVSFDEFLEYKRRRVA